MMHKEEKRKSGLGPVGVGGGAGERTKERAKVESANGDDKGRGCCRAEV